MFGTTKANQNPAHRSKLKLIWLPHYFASDNGGQRKGTKFRVTGGHYTEKGGIKP